MNNFDPPCIVICDLSGLDEGFRNQYPFKHEDRLLYLGEIKNMPGHGIYVNDKNKILWGYHTDNFRMPIEEQL